MDGSLERYEKHYENEQIIFCEYESGNSFYFIKSGQVKLIRIHDNAESILDILHAGEFMGEMAIIESIHRSVSAIALGDVIMLEFSRENFEKVVLENYLISLGLIKTFVRRIWVQQQRLKVFSYDTVEMRVVALLLNLKTEEKDDTKVLPRVNVKKEEFSKWAHVPEQECRDMLYALTYANCIKVYSDHIDIVDVNGLERILKMHDTSSI